MLALLAFSSERRETKLKPILHPGPTKEGSIIPK
jgi:hypothetical protein